MRPRLAGYGPHKADKEGKEAEPAKAAEGAGLQGVCERTAAKATTPAKPTKPAPLPNKPATVVSLVTPTPTPQPVPAVAPAVTSSAAGEAALERERLQLALKAQAAEQETLELQIRLQQQQLQSAALREQLKRGRASDTQKELARSVKQRIEDQQGLSCKDLPEAWGRETLARLAKEASNDDHLELASKQVVPSLDSK